MIFEVVLSAALSQADGSVMRPNFSRADVRELFVVMAECASDPKCAGAAAPSPELYAADIQQLDLNPQWSLRSIQSLVIDNLVFWNEHPEPATREFWRRVAERKLPFRRRDPVREALERGSLSSDSEYELAMDEVGNASSSRLSTPELQRLNELIVAYEKRGRHQKQTKKRRK